VAEALKFMKSFLAVTLLALVAAAASADTPLYIKSLPMTKITGSAKGYKVSYLTESGDPRTVYIPMQWFYPSTGATDDGFTKAELFLGFDPSYPYIQFFWKNGVFHHVRIYAIANKTDSSWGLSDSQGVNDSRFDHSKPLDLKF
jgi:hypothetical protein